MPPGQVNLVEPDACVVNPLGGLIIGNPGCPGWRRKTRGRRSCPSKRIPPETCPRRRPIAARRTGRESCRDRESTRSGSSTEGGHQPGSPRRIASNVRSATGRCRGHCRPPMCSGTPLHPRCPSSAGSWRDTSSSSPGRTPPSGRHGSDDKTRPRPVGRSCDSRESSTRISRPSPTCRALIPNRRDQRADHRPVGRGFRP